MQLARKHSLAENTLEPSAVQVVFFAQPAASRADDSGGTAPHSDALFFNPSGLRVYYETVQPAVQPLAFWRAASAAACPTNNLLRLRERSELRSERCILQASCAVLKPILGDTE